MKTIIYTKSFNGHRLSYSNFVSNLIEQSEVSLKPKIFTKNANLFFLMVDDGFLEYIIFALIRRFFGYKTVGLFFRFNTLSAQDKSLNAKLKKMLLRFTKKFKIAKTISIVPFYCNENNVKYFDSFIYDFQFWDLSNSEREKIERYRSTNDEIDFLKSVNTVNRNKFRVFSLGSQNRLKGLDKFLLNYIQHSNLREVYQFVFAGKTSNEFLSEEKRFYKSSGIGINRMITDDELLKCYASSDLVWVHYAKDYDQASGIFGRAIQLGIPPLVRDSSSIHLICQKESIPHIALKDDDIFRLSDVDIPPINSSSGQKTAARFRKVSVNNLRKALSKRE